MQARQVVIVHDHDIHFLIVSSTLFGQDDERLLHRETPLTRQLGKRSWQFGILFISPGDAVRVWYSMVRLTAHQLSHLAPQVGGYPCVE